MSRPTTCPTGKRIYWQERLATRAVTNALKRGELDPLKHYECSHCDWYHLARKTPPALDGAIESAP